MCAAIAVITTLGEKNTMLTDVPEICKACAQGSTKFKHNLDSRTCRLGRFAMFDTLSTEAEKVEALRTEERMPKDLAEMVVALAKERGKTILEVLQEENIYTP